MTLAVRDLNSAERVFNILEEFSKHSGLKINVTKTEGLWLGSDQNSDRTPLGIKWPAAMKILGIYIGYNDDILYPLNFSKRILKIKTKLNQWKRRNLSLLGKILIIKTFALPEILFIGSVLDIPQNVFKEIEESVYFCGMEKHIK